MHPFIPFISLTFLLNLPFSFGQDYYKYTNCSQPFHCGGITNITFPFWGHNRPEYCGQPGYELRCEDDRIELVTEAQTYRVLNVDDIAHRVHIVPVDTWDDSCPAPSVNISFPAQPFTYSLPNTFNITFFYGCLPIPTPSAFIPYHCSPNNSSTSNYIWTDLQSPWSGFAECELIVTVPILQRLADSFERNNLGWLQQVLREGFEVGYSMDSAFCRNCQDSDGHCGYNWNTTRPVCFCYAGEYEGRCPTDTSVRTGVGLKVAIGLPTGIGTVLVTILLFVCWKRAHLSPDSIMFWKRKEKTERVVEDFLKNYGSLVPRRYNYNDIKKITSSFKDKIGQGGYGEVYKGKIVDGREVAVKLLNKAKGDGEEFINEVASISRTSHVNVVSLLGFCFDGTKRALVYEFMANGSLEKFIYDRNPLEAQSHLGWELLYQIAIGVARGLEYLHRGCNTRILHFDIKPHNILLDQNFIPKISDFGLAKLCPRDESIISMLGARGTAGYIAPEVFSRQFGGVSHKSDVYSFGMMILEIVGKRKNIDVQVDNTSEIYFPKWVYKHLELNEELGLRGIRSKEEGEMARKMILVALWCIQTNPVDRPAMTKVVEMLEGRHESVSIPPKPYLCSPPRPLTDTSDTGETT